MEHITIRGTLTFLGLLGVCAFIATLFFIFYIHTDGVVAASTSLPSDFPGYRSSTIQIDGQSIHVALADTPALQELGLGNRDSLPGGEGMLFVFNADKPYAFWMKDMRFSIDILWLSQNGTIVFIAPNVSPATYPEDFVPTSPARYVLELPAGYAQAHGFKVGDTASL
ncbi:MAG TPA: DUF192 domain-containing protein [Candidatus Paceibacterota bacterium]|nr:DUF192 domain-containing protein [Candidatus Paceibacterota bacterium]